MSQNLISELASMTAGRLKLVSDVKMPVPELRRSASFLS